MEMTSEMKKYRAESVPVPVYQSKRRGERLRRKGVMKEMCFKFLRNCGAESAKELVLLA
jgi:hypothetical protein